MRLRTSSEPREEPTRRPGLLAVLLASIFALVVLAGRPPGPRPADAPTDQFSAARAFKDIEAIARAPHPTGSAENARVRAYLAGRLKALGLEVTEQPAPLSERAVRRLRTWKEPEVAAGVNVIGVLPGSDREAGAVAILAHHDTVSGSPGAADDAAGVAAILETVRALKASPARRRDLIVVFTDAEELDSDGARAFFDENRLARRIGAVINLEARGGGGRALMFETGLNDGPLTDLYAKAAPRPSAQSLAVLAYRLMPNSSDFTLAKDRALSGVNIAFLGGAGLYHAPQATPANTNPGSVQHLGMQALGLARALLEAPILPARGPDRVFGDILGVGMLSYSAAVGWVPVGLAALLTAFAAIRARGAGELQLKSALAGLGGAVWGLVAVALLLWAFNRLSGAGPGAYYYDRLAALPRLELQAGLVGLSVALLVAGRASPTPLARWLGVMVLGLVLAVAVQAAVPTAAPLFAWPLLATALAAAVAAVLDPKLKSPPALGVVAVMGVLAAAQTLYLAHLAFLGLGADMPQAASVFGLLAVIPLVPLLAGALTRRTRKLLAALLVLAAIGTALSVRFDPPADTVPTYARTER